MEKILLKAFKKLKKIPSINHGGCGYATYAVLLYLKKQNISLDGLFIAYMDDDREWFSKYKKYKHLTSGYGLPLPDHVTLFYKGKYYDANGILTNHQMKRFVILVAAEKFMPQLKALLDKRKDCFQKYWNPRFTRIYGKIMIESNLKVKIT